MTEATMSWKYAREQRPEFRAEPQETLPLQWRGSTLQTVLSHEV